MRAEFAPVITVAGEVLDSSNVGLPLKIQHGRSGTSSQPDAPVATFIWADPVLPFTMGAEVVITLELPAVGTYATWGSSSAVWGDILTTWDGSTLTSTTRFTGNVVALVANELDGDVYEWEITAKGVQARLGFNQIDISRPAETDIERVQAIGQAAGVPVTVIGTDATPLLADTIFKSALSALHELAGWTGGLVAQDRDGNMVYGTPGHRAIPPVAVLPAKAILDGVVWETTADDVLNHIVVKFGDPETQNTYTDTDSQQTWGYRHVEISTKIADGAAADVFGNTVLIRHRQPFYTMSQLLVSSEDITKEQHWTVNALGVSAGVILPIEVTPAPISNVAVWTVEGWEETWNDPGIQRFQVAVSDRARWGSYVLRTWEQMAVEDWQHWLDNGTWLDLMASTT